MADSTEQSEKTEEATPRRIEDAREKGQVAMSNEMVVAMGLLAALLALAWVGPTLLTTSQGLVKETLDGLARAEWRTADELTFVQMMQSAGRRFILPALGVILPVYVLSLAMGYGQIGFRLTPKAVELDWGKLSPAKGIKKIIGLRGWVRTGMATLKISAISVAMVVALYVQREKLTSLVGLDLTVVLSEVVRMLGRVALAGIAVAILIGVLDYAYQRFQHAKDMRMSKKELRDELKSSDGDPQVKARIRAIQRESARRRMMTDVPTATLVITNPTHFAVALRYDENDPNRAPWVVAKGMDLVAQNIKRIAKEAGVPIIEDPPLARGLHRMVEIGDEIPEDLFEAVARVLAFVLNPQGNRAYSGGSAV
ncbi:MAG: flagellar biosynthesis protein FlhB [Planctomycetes bacterium]|nr:flagellar biosynthesis protein FlhB [Planctomycetota bacterium]MCB9909955.1 flagellar biosynthesis protein FlhB [Planctomycetota bacterium]MCB9912908.1 flagellar biosynthesis protein FlhB [Planctomycetota bacterium]HPF13127.1 flagellar biosynthesis protein FlhB [Planctomycetota bacterium]HRV80883.1 flagellar biosynthesis protein FlhB [Planctomycetota bacterium]